MTVEALDPAAVTAAIRAALPLETARATLRVLVPDDLDAYAAYRLDPDTQRYLWRTPPTRDELAERLTTLGAIAADGDAIGIAVDVDGRLAGETLVKITDHAGRQAEIGWIIAPWARGRGLATEAAFAARDLAFAAGAHRVVAILDHENRASAAVAARIGMRQEALLIDDGVNPLTGEYGSSEVWAITARDHSRDR